MTKKRYKGVVVGCGAIGALLEGDPKRPKPATHAGALSSRVDTQLVALVDTNKKSLKAAGRLFPKARQYTALSECLRKESPDIVAIATTPRAHRSNVAQCIQASVPVIICEKPLADTLSGARAIARSVKRSGTVFILNYQRRFFKLFKRTRDEIASGKLGDIQQVTCYYSNGLYNNGGHAIDALLYLLSDHIVEVWALPNSRNTTYPKGDSNIDAILKSKKGTTISLQSVDQSHFGIHELRLLGEKGAITLGDYGYTYSYTSAEPSLFGGVQQLNAKKTKTARRIESMVKGALEQAIASLRGKKVKSSARTGLEVLSVLEALRRSAASGKKDIVRYTKI